MQQYSSPTTHQPAALAPAALKKPSITINASIHATSSPTNLLSLSALPFPQKPLELLAQAYCLGGKYHQATQCFTTLLGSKTSKPSVTVLNRAIGVAQKAGRNDAAFAWQKQVAFATPFNAAAWLKLAQLAEDIDDLTSAKTYYHRCLKRDNERLEAWFGLGVISEKEEAFDTAKLYYETLLGINPAWLPALNNWAGCCMQLECYQQAQEGFSKVLNLMPQYPKALLGMGITLDFSGQHRSACVYYSQYLRLKPTSSHSAFVRERLNELEAQRFAGAVDCR
jgi:tetratricopeptide (TPR) repeat protein